MKYEGHSIGDITDDQGCTNIWDETRMNALIAVSQNTLSHSMAQKKAALATKGCRCRSGLTNTGAPDSAYGRGEFYSGGADRATSMGRRVDGELKDAFQETMEQAHTVVVHQYRGPVDSFEWNNVLMESTLREEVIVMKDLSSV
ncbi:hypothetical protein CJ030_MR5G018718 [Morella rubra]|uniref:Uncharacterized protein n=1 Tax=Morella rubra TaxID=262757 RepID=A0A6A1VJG3_9ROSI|nr:hypothetical protein CJ030_MR5G018718 [Morella rubra]